jgi:hypothetical protein
MGAWGTGSFQNDESLDYIENVLEAPDKGRNTKTLFVIGPLVVAAGDEGDQDDIDSDVATDSIAAAEIVAAANGKPSAELTGATEGPLHAIMMWASSTGAEELRTSKVRSLAAQAVRRVRDGGELAELWTQDGEVDPAWRAGLDDLLARLG